MCACLSGLQRTCRLYCVSCRTATKSPWSGVGRSATGDGSRHPVSETIAGQERGPPENQHRSKDPTGGPQRPFPNCYSTVSDPFLILSFTPNLKTCLFGINNHQWLGTQEEPISAQNEWHWYPLKWSLHSLIVPVKGWEMYCLFFSHKHSNTPTIYGGNENFLCQTMDWLT